jgi:hypothetical protein
MFDQLIGRVQRSALFKFGGYAGRLTVLLTVVTFLWHHDQDVRLRQAEVHAQAWEHILRNAWTAEPASRGEALEILVSDGIPLLNVPLGPVRFHPQLDLSGCHTVLGIRVPNSCRGAQLAGAYLDWAYFTGVDLRGARLDHAHLQGVSLLRDSAGNPSDLLGSSLTAADLRQATLEHAILRKTRLDGTMFHGARLDWADFAESSGLVAEQLDAACICHDRLPILPEALRSYDLHRPNPSYCCCPEDRRPQCMATAADPLHGVKAAW